MPTILLGLGAPATPSGTTADPRAQMLSTGALIAFMVIVMYVLVFRPQKQKQKELAELMKNMRAGDKLITTSGIIGTIITVKEKSVTIRSGDAKLEISKAAIDKITERSGEAGES